MHFQFHDMKYITDPATFYHVTEIETSVYNFAFKKNPLCVSSKNQVNIKIPEICFSFCLSMPHIIKLFRVLDDHSDLT